MAFSQQDMMPTFASATDTNQTSLSKRRRFAPDSIPVIQCVDNSDIVDHTFESPLLFQLCQQSPSHEEIEAQLLQVGMRVRKSINEGYKTRAFTPRPFFNASRLSPELQVALSGNNDDQFSAGGLHNVGNMAMQPISTATFCGINLAALSHISSDRTSPIEEQKLWTYTTSHKRSMDDDSDSDDSQEFSMPQTPDEAIPVDYFNIEMDNMSDVSPMTRVREIRTADLLARRVAKPKSRLRSVQHGTSPQSQWNPWLSTISEQTVWEPQTEASSFNSQADMGVNDFGEAVFLQRREDVYMDCS